MHVVEYRPRPNKPQIIFVSPRVDERDICLGDKDYDLLKDAARRRLEAVKAYLGNKTICRSRQLTAYFGETNSVIDCGKCDVCRASAKQEIGIADAVVAELKQGRQSPQALQAILEGKGYSDVVDTMRDMLDRGVLYLDSNMLLSLS